MYRKFQSLTRSNVKGKMLLSWRQKRCETCWRQKRCETSWRQKRCETSWRQKRCETSGKCESSRRAVLFIQHNRAPKGWFHTQPIQIRKQYTWHQCAPWALHLFWCTRFRSNSRHLIQIRYWSLVKKQHLRKGIARNGADWTEWWTSCNEIMEGR